ncbi:MAG: ATP-binding cassette domain-containing protein [Streptosporangiales bacterium]|nr:ATP-binding cassette domain-containing protein [Streptosporangiales bacterium]
MGESEVVARLIGARKEYGSVVALDDVDLDVTAGRLLALLGPNGAGKTTVINLLCGLRRPTAGRVEVFGGNPVEPSVRRHIGMTAQETGFPETLRVGEIVDFVRAHYPGPMPAGELLERFDLADLGRRQAGGLSGGQRRRLAVALAFAGRPPLVILDEPTTGLDVEARRGLWRIVEDVVAAGTTVLLTTHYLEEAEELADEVVVIHEGRIRTRGSVAEIVAGVALTRVSFRVDGDAALPDLPGVVDAERDGNGAVTMYTSDSDSVVRALVRADVPFHDLSVTAVSLEEAFVRLTSRPEEVRQ